MANVYSAVLLGVPLGSGGGSGGPTSGTIWVVRDMTAMNHQNAWVPTTTLDVTDGAGLVIWHMAGGDWRSSELIHWQGRQIIEEGDLLAVSCSALTTVRVSGYVLSLP